MQPVVAPVGRQIGNGDLLIGEIPFAVGAEGGVGGEQHVCALLQGRQQEVAASLTMVLHFRHRNAGLINLFFGNEFRIGIATPHYLAVLGFGDGNNAEIDIPAVFIDEIDEIRLADGHRFHYAEADDGFLDFRYLYRGIAPLKGFGVILNGRLEPFDGCDVVVGVFRMLVLVVEVAAILVIVAQLVCHHLVARLIAVLLLQFQQLFQMVFGGVFLVSGGGKIVETPQGHIEQGVRVGIVQMQAGELLHNFQGEVRERVFVGRVDVHIGEHAVLRPVFAIVNVEGIDRDGHLADAAAQEIQGTEGQEVVQRGTIRLRNHGVEQRRPVADGDALQKVLVAQRLLVVVHNLFHQGLEVPHVEVGGHGTLHRRALQDAVTVLLVIVAEKSGHTAVPYGFVGGVAPLSLYLSGDVQIDGVGAIVVLLVVAFQFGQDRRYLLRRLLGGKCVHKQNTYKKKVKTVFFHSSED